MIVVPYISITNGLRYLFRLEYNAFSVHVPSGIVCKRVLHSGEQTRTQALNELKVLPASLKKSPHFFSSQERFSKNVSRTHFHIFAEGFYASV